MPVVAVVVLEMEVVLVLLALAVVVLEVVMEQDLLQLLTRDPVVVAVEAVIMLVEMVDRV
jgi:hypothetical protein